MELNFLHVQTNHNYRATGGHYNLCITQGDVEILKEIVKGGFDHFGYQKKKKNGHNSFILPPMKLIYSSKCSVQELFNDM